MDIEPNYEVELLKNKKMICRNSRFCMAKDIGTHKNIFGAELMAECDNVCAVFAAEVCDTPLIVTRTMDVEFISPVKENQIFKTYVGIEKIGNSSITLLVEIRKHSVHTEKETLVLKAKTVFVRIDEEGNPIMINDNVRSKYGYDKIGR